MNFKLVFVSLLGCLLTLTPVFAQTNSPRETSQFEFIIFPVGINVGQRNVIASTLVRGLEDGTQAVNFEDWLIPFNDVITALKLEVTPTEDGSLEVRSPGFVTRIDPDELQTDPGLGLVLSVRAVQTLFNVPTEFNLNEYAIQFNPPWLNLQGRPRFRSELPVVIEGLPLISPPDFTLTNLSQRLNITGTETNSINYQGELTAVGTILGNSWFIRSQQTDLRDSRTWQLSEVQLLSQNQESDYIVGSQPTFWRSSGGQDYWGVSTIQRWGFTPPIGFAGGGFVPSQRLQANLAQRTISGEAEPGTLVQLRESFSNFAIAEVLVDSSGVYRFENIPVQGGNYRVFLYPNGQLTAEPEIQDANFSTVPGQLPMGASALIVSAGSRRKFTPESDFLGNFTALQGGVAYRRGVTEELTLGAGIVYSDGVRGLGDFFYQPSNFPLEVSVSALTAGAEQDWDVNTALNFHPSPTLNFNFNSDRLSQRFAIDWQLFEGFTLISSGNSRDRSLETGFRIFKSSRDFSLFATASLDLNNNLRWSFFQRWGNLRLIYQGNEIATTSELSYGLSGRNSVLAGHSLFLGYDTQKLDDFNNNLFTWGWRYRSFSRAADGEYHWTFDLGYGMGSQGNGLITSTSIALFPGLDLQLRYQGISLITDSPTFRIEFVPSLNLQSGRVNLGDRRFDYFRNQGGLWIQPFFDDNSNGKLDVGEKLYTQNTDLLLTINNQPLQALRPDIRNHGIFVFLPPSTYRLELDPAGFPLDWRSAVSAYAVEVRMGSYTPVLIPFNLAYTVTGLVTDERGNAVNGAKVEAVFSKTQQRFLSIANSAGVFYLENLQQGSYDLFINDLPAIPRSLILDESSEAFQELNLRSVRESPSQETEGTGDGEIPEIES